MCKKCQSKTFTWKAVSSWKASCFTICLYIFFFLTLSLCLSLSPSLLLPWFMPGELMWEQGQPPHVCSRLGGVIESHWGLHDPNTTMTFTQPFASPEVDLEGMWLTIFICLLLLVPSNSCPLLHFHPLVSLVPLQANSLSLCSVSLSYTTQGSKCKSSRTIFFRTALISADDVTKEVKRTTQRPLQLLSPIHCL